MGLKLSEIAEILNAEVLTGHNRLDIFIDFAGATDFMSDLLSDDSENCLLLTGLNSIQAIRTAVISSIQAIVLVRGKSPLKEVIIEAKKHNLPLLSTRLTMFTACGRLFKNGIRGIDDKKRLSPKQKIQYKV